MHEHAHVMNAARTLILDDYVLQIKGSNGNIELMLGVAFLSLVIDLWNHSALEQTNRLYMLTR